MNTEKEVIKREMGFYCCQLENNSWTVAQWDGILWVIPGNNHHWKDSIFKKILDDKISFPSEGEAKLTKADRSKTPSQFQIGERVYLDFQTSGALDGFVTGIHFTKSKVRYDVSVDLLSKGSDEILKTRLYNIDSAFIVAPNQENWERLFKK